MELEKKLLASIADDDHRVRGAWIGITWMAIESRFVGLSNTYHTSERIDIANAGDLTSHTAVTLARRILSWKPLEASIGVAAINSLIEPKGKKGNVKKFITDKARGKVVTVVGRFSFYEEVAAIARKSYLLEIDPTGDELPSFACEDVLPKSDLILITGTTLINHSLQRLLELGRNGMNIVVGPTTPLSPVLFEFGADILAGVRITDSNAASKGIMQGVRKATKLRGVEPICLFRNQRSSCRK
jgi:uncharacterized protein (DUF4213/DUF364 family)